MEWTGTAIEILKKNPVKGFRRMDAIGVQKLEKSCSDPDFTQILNMIET